MRLGIGIAVKFPPGLVLPGFSAIAMMRKNIFPIYIHHLPVTTEIALKGGVYFYSYPKFLAEITFQDLGEHLEVTLKEKDDLILRIHAKKLALKKTNRFEFHTYSIKKNMVMHTLIDGWAPQLGKMMMGNLAELELGEHRISKELS